MHHSRMDDKPVFLRCDSQFIILTVKTSFEQMLGSLKFRRTTVLYRIGCHVEVPRLLGLGKTLRGLMSWTMHF